MKFKHLLLSLIFVLIGWSSLPAQSDQNDDTTIEALDTVSFDMVAQMPTYVDVKDELGEHVLLAQVAAPTSQPQAAHENVPVRTPRDSLSSGSDTDTNDNEAIDFSNPADIFKLVDKLYFLFVLLGGFLSHKIPFLNKISKTKYRVLALGVIGALGFVSFGTGILNALFTYFMSTKFYQYFLSLFIKSPKPDPSLE